METIEHYISEFNNTVWGNPVSILIGIIGIFIGIYSIRKSRKKKKVLYYKDSLNIISDSLQRLGNIEVFYKNKKAENVTITIVCIWNGGNDIINYDDLAPTDMIKIIAKENTYIYDAVLINSAAFANNISIFNSAISDEDSQIINLKFDYLGKGHGATIKLIHSGTQANEILVSGTIKGFGKVSDVDANENSSTLRRLYIKIRPFLTDFIFPINFFIMCGMLISLAIYENFTDPLIIIWIIISISCGIYCLTWKERHNYTKYFLKHFKDS